jgi:hypothetical protein
MGWREKRELINYRKIIMLLSKQQVIDEFVKYGLIDDDQQIPGVEGLIKNVALTLGSEFSFIGHKAGYDSIYAFPRYGLGKPYYRFSTPDAVYEAQLYILIHDKSKSFLPSSYNRNYDVSYIDTGSSADIDNPDSSWLRLKIYDHVIRRRIKYLLSDYIEPSDSFNVKLTPNIIMLISNDKYHSLSWKQDSVAATKGALRDQFVVIDTALNGKISSEVGKVLSSNDFTDLLKTRLDSLDSAGVTVAYETERVLPTQSEIDQSTPSTDIKLFSLDIVKKAVISYSASDSEIKISYENVTPEPTQIEIDNDTPSVEVKRWSLDWLKKAVTKYSPPVTMDDIAYDATSWNDNINGTSKNSIRDKFEDLATWITSQLSVKVDTPQVLTDVPAGALFTDTVYDATTIQAAVELNTVKITNATHTGDVTGNESLTIGSNKVLETMLSTAVQNKLNQTFFNKLDATSSPLITNDNSEGFVVGSLWVDITNDESYRCLDASTGSAVWANSTLTEGEVTVLINTNSNVVANNAKVGITTLQAAAITDNTTHKNSTHSPSDAQKNNDITKAEIEAKLTGAIATHTHDKVAGLPVHSGINNEANKVVRTQGNGYVKFGFINSTSGVSGDAITRVQCSSDAYIRYKTPAEFRRVMSLGTSIGSLISDPNTNLANSFLTNHTNGPGKDAYWHIENRFWSTNNSVSASNRGQTAVTYNGGTPRMAFRHYFNSVWAPWEYVGEAHNLWSHSITNQITNGGKNVKFGTSVGWGNSVRSIKGFNGDVEVSFTAGVTNIPTMVGITSDPSANNSYSTIDFAWYLLSSGILRIYENGASIGTIGGAYTTDDVLSIKREGKVVTYYKNGIPQRAVVINAIEQAKEYFLDTSSYPNGKVENIEFKPTSNSKCVGRFGIAANGTINLTATSFINFDEERLDNNSNFSFSSGDIIVKKAGYYLITINGISGSMDYDCRMTMQVDGSDVSHIGMKNNGGAWHGYSQTAVAFISAGGKVAVKGEINTLILHGNRHMTLSITEQ